MYLSVVIPAYNEEERICNTLESVKRYLNQRSFDYEIVVVDDGSKDNTREMVTKALSGTNYKLLENGVNRGKGFSVRRGMLESTGDLVLFSDADISTPIEEFGKLERELKNSCDLAIGSRGLKGSKIEIRQTWVREHMGKIFNFLARLLTFKGIKDSQCGFKCFKKDVAKKLFSEQKIDGFCFDAEIIYLAQKKGYKIKEVPVRWCNSSKSKLNIVSDPLSMFLDLVKIRFIHRG